MHVLSPYECPFESNFNSIQSPLGVLCLQFVLKEHSTFVNYVFAKGDYLRMRIQ